MKFRNGTAEICVPDGTSEDPALERTTSMGIGAHPDDLEIMAFSAILNAFQNDKEWFCGVVVTDGRDSPRSGPYEKCTDDDMRKIRKNEQKKAAVVGEFGSLVLLDYPSGEAKKKRNQALTSDLIQILEKTCPREVYTHNLADKQPTHVAVAVKVIEAIRRLPAKKRPKKLLGCEVWRGLDWMADGDKVVLDVSNRENLKRALLGLYDSQILSGKRYDLATLGRQRANATYHKALEVDASTAVTYAMDLTPLIENPGKSLADFVGERIDRFAREALALLKTYG